MLPPGSVKHKLKDHRKTSSRLNGHENGSATDPIRKSKKYEVKISIRPDDVEKNLTAYDDKITRQTSKDQGLN